MATFTPTANPMSITAAATVVATRPFLAKFIEWVAPATLANSCVIADLNGNLIAEGFCSVVNQAVTLWPGPTRLTLKGSATVSTGSWQVSTIQSGTLLIWF